MAEINTSDGDWSDKAVDSALHSWKDEYLTILLSAPIILAFCGGSWGRHIVTAGFSAISQVPDWYKAAFLSAVAASFGLRTAINKFGFGKS